jgi:hypothetical protein
MATTGILRERGTLAATAVAIGAFHAVVAVETGGTTTIALHGALAAGLAGLALRGARRQP